VLHFGVTNPAAVPQKSEIPEGLMNYPVFLSTSTNRTEFGFVCPRIFISVSTGDTSGYRTRISALLAVGLCKPMKYNDILILSYWQ